MAGFAVRFSSRAEAIPARPHEIARMPKYTLAYALIALLIGFGVYLVGRPSRRSRDITLK